jgi:uncharacterized membrane protein YhiD involved in acid resistance
MASLVFRVLIACAVGAVIVWQVRSRRRSAGMSIDPRKRR